VTATDWAAVGLFVAGALLVAAVVVVLSSLARTLQSLRAAVEDLNRETLPLVADLQGTARRASADLDRVEDLVGAAESVTKTVDGASRLAWYTFANPLVKVLAFGNGVGRAGHRLRRRGR
jgi:hypothetical protein